MNMHGLALPLCALLTCLDMHCVCGMPCQPMAWVAPVCMCPRVYVCLCVRVQVGFLEDWRRLNVAITRAKSGLVIVGNADTLRAGDKTWAALVKHYEGLGCIVPAQNLTL